MTRGARWTVRVGDRVWSRERIKRLALAAAKDAARAWGAPAKVERIRGPQNT
jgi:hypothetical protein